MKDPTETARDDLAFLRTLVNDGGQVQSSAGAGLFAGGLCYGVQCLVQGLLIYAPAGSPGLGMEQMLASTLPTLVFVVLMTRISLHARRQGAGVGVASRALGTAFGSMGLSILVTGTVFAYVAIQEHSLSMWLFHPIMVCVAQGVGWYMAFSIRRRRWYGAVAAGWFAAALLLTALRHDIAAYVFTLGAALLGLMALPGWVLWRSGRAGG